MSTTIVVAGKGGTGKTSIAALLIQLLSAKGVVLAIDADPATNLNQALGVPLEDTVGQIREDMTEAVQSGSLSPAVPKQEYLEQKIMASLTESKGFDLLAIGRPEGPGCYCAANNMLRLSMERLGRNYDYVVIDSEAGMEHISRQTSRDIDILLITSDLTQRGINTAAEIKGLIKEMRTEVAKICLVVNRSINGLPAEIMKTIDKHGFELVATIPQDPGIADLEIKGLPTTELAADSPLRVGVENLLSKVGLQNKVRNMGLKDQKLLSLKEIDGPVASHDGFMKREVAKRKDALDCVDDIAKLAEYIGGEIISLGRGEDWAIKKEMFPGVEILFIYNRADEEFPSNLRVLYSGKRIKDNRGEDLAELTIACVNQMLRYVKETVKEPPEICMRI